MEMSRTLRLPSPIFFFVIEMIAEIDTDESGTVDFDGKCTNSSYLISKHKTTENIRQVLTDSL